MFEVLHYVGSCIIKVLKLKVKRDKKYKNTKMQKYSKVKGEAGEKCLGSGRWSAEEEKPGEWSRCGESGENCKNPSAWIESDGFGWIATAAWIGSARNDAAVP